MDWRNYVRVEKVSSIPFSLWERPFSYGSAVRIRSASFAMFGKWLNWADDDDDDE